MEQVISTPTPAQQLQVDALRFAERANRETGTALRHTLAGNHTAAAVARVMARAAHAHLRLTAQARHQVAVQTLAGILAGEGMDA